MALWPERGQVGEIFKLYISTSKNTPALKNTYFADLGTSSLGLPISKKFPVVNAVQYP